MDMLHMLVGKLALSLKPHANGIDERPVLQMSAPAKSYGHQETFDADLTDEDYAEAILRRMADDLMAKVRADGKSVRTLTVKVRYNDMDEDQRSESLLEPTDLEADLYGCIHKLFRQAWKRRVSLRLVSLKLSNVYDGAFRAELALERSAEQHEARRRLAVVMDQLRHERGHGVLLRGHDFLLRGKPTDTASVLTQQSAKMPRRRVNAPVRRARVTGYVPLGVHSVYSFLNSTLTIDAIVGLAQQHKFTAIALADTGNLHGAVELTLLAKAAGIKPILGATVLPEGQPTCLYVQDATGCQNLCRLLSTTVRHADAEDSAEPRQVRIGLDRLADANQGLIAVGADSRLSPIFGDRFYQMVASAKDAKAAAGSRCVAVLPTHYAEPQDRWKWNIAQSIRTRTLLQEAHPAKILDGDFHLRSAAEMTTLFEDYPQVLRNTFELAERCTFELQMGAPQFPAFKPEDGSTPHAFLGKLVLEGLHRRYRDRADSLHAQVSEELSIIAEVGYEEYFLVVWDILQECRQRGIEWITRGSAADSLVCYCLGISDVCPIRFDLYFRRFLNRERMAMKKLPDIDIDFAHDRKDDVVALIFQKYGAAHTAVVGGFSTFQARSAFAEIAKVLGVAEREVRKFTDHFPWSFGGHWVPSEPAPSRGPGLMELLKSSPVNRDLPLDEEPYRTAILMAEFLDGLPRYPKMHPCGVVLSRQPMLELTATFTSNKGYPTTHFDMDAVEAIGLVKMDILAQGGLAAMRDTKQALARRGVEIDLPGLEPWKDEKVWEMIARGGSRAVHHIESPAMIGLCRQCNVRDIDGLIAIVSVIRPGAANEGKKQSFARRYQGLEPVTYPHPSLEQCLKSAFGLVVYEEHILQVCEAFAGLPPGRADVLRRALSRHCEPIIEQVRQDFFVCAKARGHDDEKIAEVWGLVRGFAGYAFCKAHSTAYGVEAYQSAWLKRYHPVEFMAGVLSNGKGFYSPLVYILECHRLGLPILPPSVNNPGPQFSVEGQSIRVPLTRVKGLTERTTARMLDERGRSEFASLADFYRRVIPTPDEMEAMIRVGAFDGFGKTRTAQFWESRHLYHAFGHTSEPGQGWLLPPPATDRLPPIPLQEPTRRQRLEWETDLLDFAASGHPLELYDDIAWDTYCPVNRLGEHVGEQVVTCGLIIEQRTHHQVTGEPMKFLTLVDWTGMVETELFAPTYRSYGLATVRYPVLEVTATVEPFENGRGFSLRVLRAGKPRSKSVALA
jgi:error-prone DNA polymerase